MFGCHSGDAGFHLFGIRTFYRPLVARGASRRLQGGFKVRKLTKGLEGGLKGDLKGG